MRMVDNIYIDGKFVIPHGVERFDLFDPARGEVIGQVRLADAEDTKRAVQAAKRAFPAFAATSKVERLELLHRLHDAMLSMSSELEEATILEYGAPVARAKWGAKYAAEAFLNAAKTLKDYNFSRPAGSAEVLMEPLGVVGC